MRSCTKRRAQWSQTSLAGVRLASWEGEEAVDANAWKIVALILRARLKMSIAALKGCIRREEKPPGEHSRRACAQHLLIVISSWNVKLVTCRLWYLTFNNAEPVAWKMGKASSHEFPEMSSDRCGQNRGQFKRPYSFVKCRCRCRKVFLRPVCISFSRKSLDLSFGQRQGYVFTSFTCGPKHCKMFEISASKMVKISFITPFLPFNSKYKLRLGMDWYVVTGQYRAFWLISGNNMQIT